MTITDRLYDAINFFHKDDRFNRVSFGLDRFPVMERLIRWRFADCLVLVLELLTHTLVYNIEPFQRQFALNDLTISHPFAEVERVSNTALFFYAIWVPLVVIVAASLVFTKPAHKLYVTYISVLGLGLSSFTTAIITNTLKNFIGRHRPDFLARCIPAEGTPTDIMVFAKDVCTTTDMEKLMDGFRTTPSGHSSISFAGLGYLSFWLAGQMIIKNYHSGAWRSVVSWLPCIGAAIIALSRTEDYRHHFVDVVVGSVLGFGIAYWSYYRYFPALTHKRAFEPLLVIAEEEPDKDFEYDTVDQV